MDLLKKFPMSVSEGLIGLNFYNTIKYIWMANQECKVRPTLFNFNSNEQSCYPDSVTVIIYSGRCNDIGKYYSKLYVPDVFKDIIIKVSYMMPRTNETRYISRHETCACKCGIYSSVCNDRQHWNNYICKC